MMETPNTSYIDSVAGNDETFRLKFIEILKKEYPGEFQHYINKYEERDFPQTASIVHKLKHKLNVCGMQEGYKLAVKYEEELKVESDRFHEQFLEVLKEVDQFIKDL
ncbi:Hpt domain-containing protein [Croceivirga thetidis]|uniref:Hpt domain-containing protein n=1 Tax=Croceivirga thetidis TaxID=2721623 RepID=A0ABX1GLG0_9FLAO|nr:Hpt domain-containing protein [Croceivirga thetidis]NKI30721.1 Hpt domain-containing protein [Croceivirga thetidis]